MLLLLVPGVVTVLSDDQNTVHGQIRAPQRQRLVDTRKDGHAVLGGQLVAHVTLVNLVEGEGGDLDARRQQAVVGGESPQELGNDDVRM